MSSLAGSIILAMAYGYEVKEPNEQKVEVSSKYLRLASETTFPGSLLVNDIPICECSP